MVHTEARQLMLLFSRLGSPSSSQTCLVDRISCMMHLLTSRTQNTRPSVHWQHTGFILQNGVGQNRYECLREHEGVYRGLNDRPSQCTLYLAYDDREKRGGAASANSLQLFFSYSWEPGLESNSGCFPAFNTTTIYVLYASIVY